MLRYFVMKLKTVTATVVTWVTKKVTGETLLVSAASIFGIFASLTYALNGLFWWMVGPPRLSREERLAKVVMILELKQYSLDRRKMASDLRIQGMAKRVDRIQQMPNGPNKEKLREQLNKTITNHVIALKSKDIPRLTLEVNLLEAAKQQLQE